MRSWPFFVALLAALLLAALIVSCSNGGDDDDDNDDNDDAGDDDDDDDIWQPSPGTSWQWQLLGTIDTSFDVEMYDVDLFDVPTEKIQELKDDGRIVICYFSAGSYEDWRDDESNFPKEALGNDLDEWEGEQWLDIRSDAVREIMKTRLDLAVDRGCDGVEPDNMDGYANDTGFDLTPEDQLGYNRFIADAAHERGLSVGLKNDVDQLDELVSRYDWALNEECHAYDECDAYETFTNAGKAVFNAEYVDDWEDAQDLADEICGNYPALSVIIKEWDLTARRLSCDE